MRSVPVLSASQAASSPLYSAPAALHACVRLIKFRYHLSYASVVFGAVIYPGGSVTDLAVPLVVLYVLFNVLLYGGIYTLNDVADLESDRRHPLKCRRPVAAGEVGEAAAVSLAVAMIGLALAGATWTFGPVMTGTFAGFLALNAFYSAFARNIPGLDLAFNSLTHPLRFVMGASLAGHSAHAAHVAVMFAIAVGVASLRRSVERGRPGWAARRTLRAYSCGQLADVRWAAFALMVVPALQAPMTSWPFFAAVVPAYILTVFLLPLSSRARRAMAAYWTT